MICVTEFPRGRKPHTNSKGFLRVDGMRKKLRDEMFCFCLMHTKCSLLRPFWVASFIKGQVKQACFNLCARISGKKCVFNKRTIAVDCILGPPSLARIQIEACLFNLTFYKGSHSKGTKQRALHVHQTKTKHFSFLRVPLTPRKPFEFVCNHGFWFMSENVVFRFVWDHLSLLKDVST